MVIGLPQGLLMIETLFIGMITAGGMITVGGRLRPTQKRGITLHQGEMMIAIGMTAGDLRHAHDMIAEVLRQLMLGAPGHVTVDDRRVAHGLETARTKMRA
jgi:hypothetical protein